MWQRGNVSESRRWESVEAISWVVIAEGGGCVLGRGEGVHYEMREDARMSQQSIKQEARRMAREMAKKRRREQADRERRMSDLAEQVMVALGERDLAVEEAERRAGKALREWIDVEGLPVVEAVEWCGVSVREVKRLRCLAQDPAPGNGAVGAAASIG